MKMNSDFFRRTGRTERMITAAIKAAVKGKEVYVVTSDGRYSDICKKIFQLIGGLKGIEINTNKERGWVEIGRGRIEVKSAYSHDVDQRRFVVMGAGQNAITYFDHHAIERIYGNAIEKWLEFVPDAPTSDPGI